jgi:fucose permease
MVLLGFSAAFLLCIAMLVFRNQWALLVLIFVMGFVLGPVWPMIMGIGTSSHQQRSGTVASILSASGGFGAVISPLLMGIAAKHSGFYGGFWLLAGISLIGFIVMIKKKR